MFDEITRGDAVAEKKVSRKELLNEPDEFISTTSRVITYARENPNLLISCIVVSVLAVVIGLGIYAYQSKKESTAFSFERISRFRD